MSVKLYIKLMMNAFNDHDAMASFISMNSYSIAIHYFNTLTCY